MKSNLFEKLAPVLIILAIVLAGAVGYLASEVKNLKGGKTTTTNTAAAPAPQPSVSLDTIKGLWGMDIIKFGSADSKLLLVEVGDPSCPYCHIAGGYDPELAREVGTQFQYKSDGGSYVPPVTEMEKLVKDGKASFAYVYFPGHGNGEMAMKSLFCANDQGKFWDAHNLLMTNAGYELQNTTVKNDKTKSQVVADFLSGVLDAPALKDCLDSGKYDDRLAQEQDLASGTLGVTGTPGFFINDKLFPGAYSWEDLKSTVEAALK